jgi:hypothetical protein
MHIVEDADAKKAFDQVVERLLGRLGQCVTFGLAPLAGVRGVVTIGIVP